MPRERKKKEKERTPLEINEELEMCKRQREERIVVCNSFLKTKRRRKKREREDACVGLEGRRVESEVDASRRWWFYP